jgi:hypothetical protein
MLAAGNSIQASGDFTFYRYIKALSHEQLESKLGFQPGRLSRGAAIAVMTAASIDSLQSFDFILGASTRWSRSSAAAPWAPDFAIRADGTMQPNAIESRLALDGKDPQALKNKIIAFMKLARENRPAKVFPAWRHEEGMLYPDAIGAGLPQFRLINARRWVVVRVSTSSSVSA